MVKYINICRNTDQARNNGEIKKNYPISLSFSTGDARGKHRLVFVPHLSWTNLNISRYVTIKLKFINLLVFFEINLLLCFLTFLKEILFFFIQLIIVLVLSATLVEFLTYFMSKSFLI